MSDERSPRPPRSPGGFRVFDLMLLTAAGAIGYAVSRAAWPFVARPSAIYAFTAIPIAAPAFWKSDPWAFESLGWMPLVASASIAVALARRTRPSRPGDRLEGEPGWVACCLSAATVLVVLGPVFAMDAATALLDTGISRWHWLARSPGYRALVPPVAAAAVAGGWLAQAMGGRWRPEPSWTDRAGRLLGLAWIAWGSAFVILSARDAA